ncbi:hypothetical protein [Haloarcula halophila]|uniref:hypothetical protein n=1 Tax=Haloarcula TaxID=2237 RepID=UPI0023E35AF9|nr:hypothetical protein [Halomicroarcula sp. DFY41]
MGRKSYTRRQLIRTSGLVGTVVLAGCSGEDESVTDPDPPTVDDATEVDTVESAETAEDDQPVTFRPEEMVIADDDSVVSVTGQQNIGGRDIDLYTSTFDGWLGACLERYWVESYSNPELERGEGEVSASDHYRLHVLLPSDQTVSDLQAVYNNNFNPPSKPFKPALDDWRELVPGEETSAGLEFTLPVSSEIREVNITKNQLISSNSAVSIQDNTIVLPYEELSPAYLRYPVTKARVTMTTEQETYYLHLPYPDISIESFDFTARSSDEGVQLEQLSAEVSIESEKPTQYVNLHTDFGGSLTRDYLYEIDADDFEAIDGSGTTEITRDLSSLPHSERSTVGPDNFQESFPIRQNEFSIVVGQIAPLARDGILRRDIVE